jgi:hypothetical protein
VHPSVADGRPIYELPAGTAAAYQNDSTSESLTIVCVVDAVGYIGKHVKELCL